MAILNNKMFSGLSGMIGKTLVFRQVNGKTIVSNRPGRARKNKKSTDNNTAFREATQYARTVGNDPRLKATYAANKHPKYNNTYNAAVGDYLNKPEIKLVDVTAYSGKPGDSILIHAVDDFKVLKVEVVIYDSRRNIIEKGIAIVDPINGEWWRYVTSIPMADVANTAVWVRVWDIPGNFVDHERVAGS